VLDVNNVVYYLVKQVTEIVVPVLFRNNAPPQAWQRRRCYTI